MRHLPSRLSHHALTPSKPADWLTYDTACLPQHRDGREAYGTTKRPSNHRRAAFQRDKPLARNFPPPAARGTDRPNQTSFRTVTCTAAACDTAWHTAWHTAHCQRGLTLSGHVDTPIYTHADETRLSPCARERYFSVQPFPEARQGGEAWSPSLCRLAGFECASQSVDLPASSGTLNVVCVLIYAISCSSGIRSGITRRLLPRGVDKIDARDESQPRSKKNWVEKQKRRVNGRRPYLLVCVVYSTTAASLRSKQEQQGPHAGPHLPGNSPVRRAGVTRRTLLQRRKVK